MNVSQKSQYALRALLELGKDRSGKPMSSTVIGEAQAIPVRFLEAILVELKQAGWLASRRGVGGGHMLTADPAAISVGDVVRLIDGPLTPVGRRSGGKIRDDVFAPVWVEAEQAITAVLDGATLDELLRRDSIGAGSAYTI
jgi:Rrf2 family transcriptional regulator, cysteine metabolism repressor